MFLSLSQQLVYLWNVYNVHCSSSCDEKLTGNACIDLCFKIITFHNSKDNNGEDCFLLSRASSSLPYIQKVLNVCKDCFSLKVFSHITCGKFNLISWVWSSGTFWMYVLCPHLGSSAEFSRGFLAVGGLEIESSLRFELKLLKKV